MRLAFITDEVSQDTDTIIAFAKHHSLEGLELRSVAGTAIDRLSAAKARELAARFRDEGLELVCLASSFGKHEADESFTAELEKLDRLIPLARIFGTKWIRGFAGFRAATVPAVPPLTPELLETLATRLGSAYSRLADNGLELLLEADPSVYTSSHKKLAQLLQVLTERYGKSPYGAIYDPGNSVYAPGGEEPWPTAWEAIRPWLRHVHVKDAIRRRPQRADGIDAVGDEVECLRVGDGSVNWRAVLAGLRAAGYEGWLSMETHYRLTGQLDEETLKRPGGAAFSDGGLEATAESVEALRALWEDVK
ncbi:MAG: sugar phosphate isomerase/epimerase family protein [Bacillota bacterium]|nr:sugar phosphate isomerase/epimerase family protein [Bacillota bacterium]